jgi:hypothetical protein
MANDTFASLFPYLVDFVWDGFSKGWHFEALW